MIRMGKSSFVRNLEGVKVMSDIKILEVIDKGSEGVLNIYDIKYLNKSGKEMVWNLFSRKGIIQFERDLVDKKNLIADGIIICAIHKDTGKLVVLEEYRVSVNSKIIAFPGGLVNEGETYEDTAIRELKEETNLDLQYIDKELGMRPTYSAIGITDETVAIVYGECTGVPKDMQEDNEQGKVLLLSIDDVEQILKRGEYQLCSRTELIFENLLLRKKYN